MLPATGRDAASTRGRVPGGDESQDARGNGQRDGAAAEEAARRGVPCPARLRHPDQRRRGPNSPTIGFLGSSNLTLPGLSSQGELNVDVLDHDACDKLGRWFEDRWN